MTDALARLRDTCALILHTDNPTAIREAVKSLPREIRDYLEEST